MTQEDINQSEWRNPDNWSGEIYFSKRDSRAWVPKRTSSFVCAINLGNKRGPACLVCVLLGLITLILAIGFVTVILIIKNHDSRF